MTHYPEHIVAGGSIGPLSLSDSEVEILSKLRRIGPVTTETRVVGPVHKCGPYKVWIEGRTKRTTQITVGKGFRGRFLGTIGIGSTLAQLRQVAGRYYEELDAYLLHDHPGICFELADVGDPDQDWDEETAPIEFISIFPPESK